MSFELTQSAKNAFSQSLIEPNLVLEVDGYSDLFGVVDIRKKLKYGDPVYYGDDGLTYGMTFDVTPNGFPYLMLKQGETSRKISQQLEPDKARTASVSNLKVEILDVGQKGSRLISPGVELADILGRKVSLYIGAKGLLWPDDYVSVFKGIISETTSKAGSVVLTLQHPDNKKRQDIFIQASAELVGDINAGVTTITLNDSSMFLYDMYTDISVSSGTSNTVFSVGDASKLYEGLSIRVYDGISDDSGYLNISNLTGTTVTVDSDMGFTPDNTYFVEINSPFKDTSIEHYVRIDDEIIAYDDFTSNSLNGVVRGALGTTASSHDDGARVTSFYVLSGNAMDLALKVMLSGYNGTFATEGIHSIRTLPSIGEVTNGLFFTNIDLEDKHGLTAGDFVTITGASNSENNVTLKTIESIIKTTNGSYLTITGVTFTSETPFGSATCSFRSRYDTLGDGLSMSPSEVDVDRHELIKQQYLSTFSYEFYLKEDVKGRDFVELQLYRPCACYALPRKSRSSVGYTIGAIPTENVVELTIDNIVNPQRLALKRSLGKNFYNAVVHKFDEDILSERFLGGIVTISNDSINRIDVGTKAFVLEAKGIRSNLEAELICETAATRLLNRYRYGAEFFDNVQVFFRDGFKIEPGDLVLFNFDELNVTDSSSGDRTKPSRFYEVTNKSLDFSSGVVTISLVDTSFGANERFGSIAPSSRVSSGATTTLIPIKDSYGAIFPGDERRKWLDYIGLSIRVHSEDYSFDEEVTFTGFDPSNPSSMQVTPALSTAPIEDYVVDIAEYPSSTDERVNRTYKLFHTFQAPRITVTGGSSDTVFTVGASDAAKFNVGATVLVHTTDFSTASGEVLVTNVSGTTITVGTSLGFTPASGYEVDYIGFADNGAAYRYI